MASPVTTETYIKAKSEPNTTSRPAEETRGRQIGWLLTGLSGGDRVDHELGRRCSICRRHWSVIIEVYVCEHDQPMGRIPHELKAVRQSFVSQRPNLTGPLNLLACTQDTTKPIAQQKKVELQACCSMYAWTTKQREKDR